MNATLGRWAPAAVLLLGALGTTVGVDGQRALPLAASLATTLPGELLEYRGRDVVLSEDEVRVAGVSSYLMRAFAPLDPATAAVAGFSLYVGYYDRQMRGRTIHSPRNCLPGAGWSALASRVERIETAQGPVPVNRYILQNGAQRAVVFYWYQGRGRVAANEYLVKWDLLRDAALLRRSEEALVRVVVPVRRTEDEASAVAARAAGVLIPALRHALPS